MQPLLYSMRVHPTGVIVKSRRCRREWDLDLEEGGSGRGRGRE